MRWLVTKQWDTALPPPCFLRCLGCAMSKQGKPFSCRQIDFHLPSAPQIQLKLCTLTHACPCYCFFPKEKATAFSLWGAGANPSWASEPPASTTITFTMPQSCHWRRWAGPGSVTPTRLLCPHCTWCHSRALSECPVADGINGLGLQTWRGSEDF